MVIFDPSYYYRLSTDNFLTERSLCTGNTSTKPQDVRMSNTGRFSSDNWQLFFQEGIYFLRNFDYNNTYHLGIDISNSDRSTPVMLRATADLGQQWFIIPSDPKNQTFRLRNRLLDSEHNPVSLLGNAVDDKYSLHMHALSQQQSGIKWTITQHPDQGVVPREMMSPYPTIQQDPSANKTIGATNPSSTTSQSADIFFTGQLTPITIAGIVVGIVVFLGAVVIFTLFWLRYKKLGPGGIRGVPGPTPPPRHGRAEIVDETSPKHNERISQASTLNAGLSGHEGNRTRRKESDAVSIELPAYGKPSVEERSFV